MGYDEIINGNLLTVFLNQAGEAAQEFAMRDAVAA